jgi:hypothetical protein
MSVPTSGETFAKLIHHMREVQDCLAMMSHLDGLNDNPDRSKRWLAMEESFKRMIHTMTQLAQGRMH